MPANAAHVGRFFVRLTYPYPHLTASPCLSAPTHAWRKPDCFAAEACCSLYSPCLPPIITVSPPLSRGRASGAPVLDRRTSRGLNAETSTRSSPGQEITFECSDGSQCTVPKTLPAISRTGTNPAFALLASEPSDYAIWPHVSPDVKGSLVGALRPGGRSCAPPR